MYVRKRCQGVSGPKTVELGVRFLYNGQNSIIIRKVYNLGVYYVKAL
jgi:hypothetical protein